MSVTGPSFTNSTSIRAPNRPRLTGTPHPAIRSATRRYNSSARSGAAALVGEDRVAPLGDELLGRHRGDARAGRDDQVDVLALLDDNDLLPSARGAARCTRSHAGVG